MPRLAEDQDTGLSTPVQDQDICTPCGPYEEVDSDDEGEYMEDECECETCDTNSYLVNGNGDFEGVFDFATYDAAAMAEDGAGFYQHWRFGELVIYARLANGELVLTARKGEEEDYNCIRHRHYPKREGF